MDVRTRVVQFPAPSTDAVIEGISEKIHGSPDHQSRRVLTPSAEQVHHPRELNLSRDARWDSIHSAKIKMVSRARDDSNLLVVLRLSKSSQPFIGLTNALRESNCFAKTSGIVVLSSCLFNFALHFRKLPKVMCGHGASRITFFIVNWRLDRACQFQRLFCPGARIGYQYRARGCGHRTGAWRRSCS